MKKWGNINRTLGGLLIILFLFGTALGQAQLPTHAAQARTHPTLVQIAAEYPNQVVSVIVQKTGFSDRPEKSVVQLGGKITHDLRIIHGFAAEMPAKVAVKLGNSPFVRWVSPDTKVVEAEDPNSAGSPHQLDNDYIRAINADDLWAEGYQGSTVTVAVVDSGISRHYDIRYRIVTSAKFVDSSDTTGDSFGHGTHVAGIIGGNGTNSYGKYVGVAPQINFINVKISDGQGQSFMSDLVAGLQWVYENKDTYNIRVVNLSLNSTVAESYHSNPLDAALEILWFNGVVVVVSAGNNGSDGILYPPANDPFVITVGAVDDMGTPEIGDDLFTNFSAYGTTESGYSKPDLVAPGRNIVSTLAGGGCFLSKAHPDHRIYWPMTYFRMSGTSMASAVVTGAIGLLLQDEPGLSPDQVKYRLMASAAKGDRWPDYDPLKAGAGYLDIYAAVHNDSIDSANTGITPSQLLWTGDEAIAWDSVSWNSVSWNSVSWNSVSWNSVSWNSVSWNSVSWNSDYWEP